MVCLVSLDRSFVLGGKSAGEAGERRRWLGEIADVEPSVGIRWQVQEGAARDGGGGRRRRGGGGDDYGCDRLGEQTKTGFSSCAPL